MSKCSNPINDEWKQARRYMRASGCFLTSTRASEGHRRDAVPQDPEDWLMRLCKGLKTLSFTVN
jgi:hypothetical protein